MDEDDHDDDESDDKEDDDDDELWSGTNKNQDVSTGPLARPFACLLVPLTRSLAPDCSLRSRPPLRSFICSLAHFAHSFARGTVNDWVAILSLFFFLFSTIVDEQSYWATFRSSTRLVSERFSAFQRRRGTGNSRKCGRSRGFRLKRSRRGPWPTPPATKLALSPAE